MAGCQPIIIEQPHHCPAPKQSAGAWVLVGVIGTFAALFAASNLLMAANQSSDLAAPLSIDNRSHQRGVYNNQSRAHSVPIHAQEWANEATEVLNDTDRPE